MGSYLDAIGGWFLVAAAAAISGVVIEALGKYEHEAFINGFTAGCLVWALVTFVFYVGTLAIVRRRFVR